MADLLDALARQGPVAGMLLGTAALVAAVALLRMVRRIRRTILVAAVLLGAGGSGTGGGWLLLDTLSGG
ncbi:hypothetical protein [Mycolicibacterium iranicum]|uniref:Uncharacterized protein n=1 Tax=Mycolicibacterium iranicum TaxID=912594 RepID=A0ABT4HKB5_MYCIR|nr:hypothetical protein [Mycolicibacterium iranicum]MCZ0730648.1 hypothetical protein [Mycolicibacterium iranicum]